MQKQLSDLNIVVMGGGTGSFSVLKGLKNYPCQITAIVSMFDSGGSTGLLRDEFGILPPGDVRRCLVALAPEEHELRKLFLFRFPEECSLKGHAFGNLFLTALHQIYQDMPAAIQTAGKLLGIKGSIYPVTLDHAHLKAVLEDNTEIVGETNIALPKHNGFLRIHQLLLTRNAELYPPVRKALLEAHLIIFAPGDLYTSIIPNLLVDECTCVLAQSKAKKVYVCNIMTKHGETTNYKTSDFAREILRYLSPAGLDHMICNQSQFDKEILAKYDLEMSKPVEIDHHNMILPFIVEDLAKHGEIARHDPEKLAEVIIAYAKRFCL